MFRIATEGATTDGRNIERQALEQMAANYDPKKYGARIWLEHMRGMLPDGIFKALGDVTKLTTKEVEDGKLGLFADIDPTDDLKAINDARQKIYTSIEIDPNFADTGQAYLVGLGVTDSPASLGTDMLHFSSQQNISPLASRKQRPENLFSAAVLTEFDFSDPQDPAANRLSLLDHVKALFNKHRDDTRAELTGFVSDLEDTLEMFVEKNRVIEEELAKHPDETRFNELKAAQDKLRADHDALYQKLDTTPDTPRRPPAIGGNGANVETDC